MPFKKSVFHAIIIVGSFFFSNERRCIVEKQDKKIEQSSKLDATKIVANKVTKELSDKELEMISGGGKASVNIGSSVGRRW